MKGREVLINLAFYFVPKSASKPEICDPGAEYMDMRVSGRRMTPRFPPEKPHLEVPIAEISHYSVVRDFRDISGRLCNCNTESALRVTGTGLGQPGSMSRSLVVVDLDPCEFSVTQSCQVSLTEGRQHHIIT